ncbi:MAG: hypothetical protein RIQ62_1281 [Bacteroidota bacterium]|jgi:hypothetical protein
MKKLSLLALCLVCSLSIWAQSPGDTLTVQTFQYGSTTRDTVVHFPNTPGLTFEKVLMLYNIRCKNGLVSPATSGQTNIGCGEWDYSCNTYITDSSRVDSMQSTRPSHSISNYSGGVYPYTTTPFFNLYQFSQTQTTTSILSENQYPVGTGSLSSAQVLAADKKSGRSQYLFTAAELSAAGVTAGPIAGILLNALNSNSVQFLKIQMKHSSLTALDPGAPDLLGFTETYNANTNVVSGSNRLQFYTPFVWDGISNIIIDLSFTNSTPNNTLLISTHNTGANLGMYTQNGYYINTANGIVSSLPPAPFSAISNEITVSFWCRGDAGINTVNTSIIEAIDAGNHRQLNMHLPWSNANVYFDCGNLGSGYDRINKAAALPELQGQWNYWTFTKNAVSGIMNIYLNGGLWHTGSAKTNPINIDSVVFGANIAYGNHYKGDIDELAIFNKEMNAADIAAWMYKSIDATHPNYSNLLAYYKLDEGSGTNSTDASVSAQQMQFPYTPDWRFTRGDKLERLFTATQERPNITFLQGSYTLSNTNVLVYDSVAASPNIVKTFSIASNAGTSISDAVNVSSTNIYWLAKYRYIYDGVTGALIDSLPVTAVDTIYILDLPFTDRYPSKFEILSFVTPYGINLDMGMNGKTWTFDMTDYLPILQGNKRITVERGGEWQENMDIKFLFIVGTPPHNVLDISQIWRQPSNCNYNDIVTNKYFEPRNVKMNANGKSFKIRTTITGHGQEGEFIPRMHALNINGGTNEFEWLVYKKCASNPLYPQGGTWIYDRSGWCPGMASDLKESDITPYVTPGQVANIDYTMLPDSGIGTSNYIVTNQLVTYGDMNFTVDAAITDILAPTQKIEYAREQAICNHPKIMIRNTGSTPLTSLRIDYWINNNTSLKSTFQWTGNIAPMAQEEVELPANQLWVNVNSANNTFYAEVSLPNGVADMYSYNNTMRSDFVITDVVPADFIIYHRTNNAASETKYELFDVSGVLIFSRTGMSNLTTYRDTFHLTQGCYRFVMTDTDEDGISFWANSDGAGVLKFLRSNGTTLKTFNPDFGASRVYNFTIDYPLSYEQLYESHVVKIYPNPVSDQFSVEADGIEKANVQITNSVGQTLSLLSETSIGKRVYSVKGLAAGIYFVNVQNGNQHSSHKVIVE